MAVDNTEHAHCMLNN